MPRASEGYMVKDCADNELEILVVLDDLDGFDPEELKEVPDVSTGDDIDVVYTTRNPLCADPYSFLHAAAFEVPPIEIEEGSELI